MFEYHELLFPRLVAATFSGIIKRGEPNRFDGKSGRGDGAKKNSIIRWGFQNSCCAARDVWGGKSRGEATFKRSLRDPQ